MSSAQPPQAPPGRSADTPRLLWKTRQDGRTVFRHQGPLVLWWVWMVFALVNIIYLAIDDRTIGSLRGILALLTVTGGFYACTLHSRVETDDEGVTVYNPLRDHRLPWGIIEGVTLGDSVEIACSRPDAGKPRKIYSWALYSSRRSRARAQMGRTMFRSSAQRGLSLRAPAEAAELARQQASQLMTIELSRRATAATEAGKSGGKLRSFISWRPVAAIVAPALALLIAYLIH